MRENANSTRWVLGFDGECRTGGYFAQQLVDVAEGKLAVKSLHSDEVRRWTADALALDAPPAPILFAIDDASIQAWTGNALVLRLARLLGPQKAWQATMLLGGLIEQPATPDTRNRRHILRQGLIGTMATFALLSGHPQRVHPGVSAKAESTANDLVALNNQRPGRYSRQEGIDRWRVDQKPGGAVVRFEHNQRRLSGTLSVNYSGNGSTGTWVLSRGQQQFQIAMSGRVISGRDARGRAMTARFDVRRRRWDVSAESGRAFRDNERDFNIGFAIAADLAPVRRPRSGAKTDVTAQGGGTCSEILPPNTLPPKEPLGVCYDNKVSATSGPELSWTAEIACEEVCSEHIINECQRAPGVPDRCSGCCDYDSPETVCGVPPYISSGFGCTCYITAHPYANCG